MSNEVKLENAKPGMWAEFDTKGSPRFKDGHHLLELVTLPEPEGVLDKLLATIMKVNGVDGDESLGVKNDGFYSLIIDQNQEPLADVLNLHVYAEKPEPEPEWAEATGYIFTADANTAKGIPTEPGLYRAATGSVWYYDGKSWTPITDHDGDWTYAQKQNCKRFIETSIASHRMPFTPISLPNPDDPSPVDDMPTEPGFYMDVEHDLWYLDDHGWHSLSLISGDLTQDDAAKYTPMIRFDNLEEWVRDRV